jgi:CheY-like chemotaxis protein
MVNERARILIADDEDVFLEPTAQLLKSAGYDCDCVHRAEEAAELLLANAYDLLITDINMPGNRNLEFLRQNSQNPGFMPVIVVTGYPSIHTAVESLRLSVVDYVIKPFDATSFLNIVTGALEKGNAIRTMREARANFTEWLDQMKEMEPALLSDSQDKRGNVRCTLDWYLSETVRLFANLTLSMLTTLNSIRKAHAGADTEVCTLMNCPRLNAYQAGVRDAVEVLIQTKNAFKSKELGELRKRLEGLLNSMESA